MRVAYVDVPDWEDVELVARRGDSVLLHWMLLTGAGAFRLDEAPDCLEFRRRAPTGRRSTAVVLCGDVLAERPFPGAPASEPGATEQDASAASASSGADAAPRHAPASAAAPSPPDACSAAPGARASSSSTLVILLGLAALSLRRSAATRS